MTSGFGLIVSLGVLSAIGSGAGSFSVLIGGGGVAGTSRRIKRGLKRPASSTPGESLGQFVSLRSRQKR